MKTAFDSSTTMNMELLMYTSRHMEFEMSFDASKRKAASPELQRQLSPASS